MSQGSLQRYTDQNTLKSWGQPEHLRLPATAGGTDEEKRAQSQATNAFAMVFKQRFVTHSVTYSLKPF